MHIVAYFNHDFSDERYIPNFHYLYIPFALSRASVNPEFLIFFIGVLILEVC